MRIFHVCADAGIPPDGTKGASVHLRSIAAGLRRLGHDVTMF
nr:glycosyltransferase family 1 protein [Actinomycetota bacterium]